MIGMYDGATTTLGNKLTSRPVGVLIYSIVAHTGAVSKSNITINSLEQLYTAQDGLSGKVGVSLQKGSANRLALLKLWGGKAPHPQVPGPCPAPSGKDVPSPTCSESSYAGVYSFVNATPNAIGYVAVDHEVDGHPTAGYPDTSTIYTKTSVMNIGGDEPSPGNIHDGSYPFVVVEHLYLPPQPTALAKSFLAYLSQYLTSYKSPDFTTCSNAPPSLAAECSAAG
jgi:PBP superfamily domain